LPARRDATPLRDRGLTVKMSSTSSRDFSETVTGTPARIDEMIITLCEQR